LHGAPDQGFFSGMSDKSQNPVLLFDLGGVLIENRAFEDLPKLLPGAVPSDVVFDRWLESPAVQRFERGEIEPDLFANAFLEEWNLPLTRSGFLDAFTNWVVGPFPGVVELLCELARNYTVAFLSNCNSLHWDRMTPVLAVGDHAFSSHHWGVVKPDPAIFQRAIATLGRAPGDILFFDDSIKNIAAAKASGIKAFRTVGFGAVRAQLRELGLAAG
jgi:putative hydrolase of the HAD superfamily